MTDKVFGSVIECGQNIIVKFQTCQQIKED